MAKKQHHNAWSDAENEVLKRLYCSTVPIDEVFAALPRRKRAAIMAQAGRLGLRRPRLLRRFYHPFGWTPEAESRLAGLWRSDASDSVVAAAFPHRSWSRISARAERLGLIGKESVRVPVPGLPNVFADRDGLLWYGNGRQISGSMHGGYLRLHVTIAGTRRRLFVHQAVCAAFHGACPDGMECCHNDGNTLNNRPENLRWGTHADNIRDRDVVHRTAAVGERSGAARLTDEIVREMRRRCASGEPRKTVAAAFNVPLPHLCNIVNRRSWKYLTD